VWRTRDSEGNRLRKRASHMPVSIAATKMKAAPREPEAERGQRRPRTESRQAPQPTPKIAGPATNAGDPVRVWSAG